MIEKSELPITATIDVEKAEEDLKDFLREGRRSAYRLGREGIEELHMGLGDDHFYVFIHNMELLIDEKGSEYIESFEEDYEVPPEPKKKPSFVKEFRQRPSNYLHYILQRFQSRNAKPPSYIIMSRDMYDMLHQELIQTGNFYNHSDYKGRSFHGIPIAFVDKTAFIEIV